jgi:hypothetical protein
MKLLRKPFFRQFGDFINTGKERKEEKRGQFAFFIILCLSCKPTTDASAMLLIP